MVCHTSGFCSVCSWRYLLSYLCMHGMWVGAGLSALGSAGGGISCRQIKAVKNIKIVIQQYRYYIVFKFPSGKTVKGLVSSQIFSLDINLSAVITFLPYLKSSFFYFEFF